MWKPGDCFLIETDHYKDGTVRSHLFVIVLKPEPHTQNTIVVSIRTNRGRGVDNTTELEPGVHEFIKSKSWVVYRRARIVSLIELESLILDGSAKPMVPMPPKITKMICDGLLRSRFTPQDVRLRYSNQLFNDI